MQLVRSNDENDVIAKTTQAFEYHSPGPITGKFEDVRRSLKLLTELNGVGPATGSLILSCYDPEDIPFFSDELYRWLHLEEGNGGDWDRRIKYTSKEYESLYEMAHKCRKSMKTRNGRTVTALELEKAAYVLGKRATGSGQGKRKQGDIEGAVEQRRTRKKRTTEISRRER